jgi:hypothetical protein
MKKPSEQDKLRSMIDELVDHEIDMMDIEGLYQYATDKLWYYFDQKTPTEVQKMYADYKKEWFEDEEA